MGHGRPDLQSGAPMGAPTDNHVAAAPSPAVLADLLVERSLAGQLSVGKSTPRDKVVTDPVQVGELVRFNSIIAVCEYLSYSLVDVPVEMPTSPHRSTGCITACSLP